MNKKLSLSKDTTKPTQSTKAANNKDESIKPEASNNNATDKPESEEPEESTAKIPVKNDDQSHSEYTTIFMGEALKLSPKTLSKIYFEVAKHKEDKQVCVRLTGNDGGGLHSKEWIELAVIIELLDQIDTDKPFTSLLLKPAFMGKSANNASFLAAVCRSAKLKLIIGDPDKVFQHRIHPEYEESKSALMKLAELTDVSK